ncbi:Arc family DNA-binding protein [Curvibacter sp. HBC61]|uniref:Arc family DNA-binding protein n=1 Tax=Curvibacter cyanobacteriorum TaxID=3026422 RepID=A0ABT5MWU7_9BURK|nr:Arc family DNA-binding protein [Curvibacter sp. HBC61]MDD0837926.1 Arc family DNA-binding protein [Curvibacter sp. HBC61]
MSKKPFPSEIQERFIVRLPDGMRDQIASEAKSNQRSMNAEIVHRLQQTFQPGGSVQLGDTFEVELAEMVEEVVKALGHKVGTARYEFAFNELIAYARQSASREAKRAMDGIAWLAKLQRENPEALANISETTATYRATEGNPKP